MVRDSVRASSPGKASPPASIDQALQIRAGPAPPIGQQHLPQASASPACTVAPLEPIVFARACARCTVARGASTTPAPPDQRPVKLPAPRCRSRMVGRRAAGRAAQAALLGHRARRSCSEPPWLTTTPFGRAGGARGVDHVGGVARVEVDAPAPWSGCRAIAGQSASSRTMRGAGRAGRQPLEQRAPASPARRAGVGQHEGQPLGRVVGIERQVGGAGLEDAESPISISGERSTHSPTMVSGPTPRPRR